MTTEIENEELEFEENEQIESRYDIDYTVDSYSIRDILALANRGRIKIPEFQRTNAWTTAKKSLFIDSILLNLPTPNILFYEKNGVLYLIDGAHRIRTIKEFFDGEIYITTRNSIFSGKRYSTLEEDDVFEFEDYRIAYINFKETSPETGNSVYEVFNRINSKSEPLSQQEIRNAVYYGPFLKKLKSRIDSFEYESIPEDKYEKLYIRKDKQTEIIVRYLSYSKYNSLTEKTKKNKSQIIDDYLKTHENEECGEEEFSKFEANYKKFDRLENPFHWKNKTRVVDLLVETFLISSEDIDELPNWITPENFNSIKLEIEKMDFFNKATTNYTNFEKRVELMKFYFNSSEPIDIQSFTDKYKMIRDEING